MLQCDEISKYYLQSEETHADDLIELYSMITGVVLWRIYGDTVIWRNCRSLDVKWPISEIIFLMMSNKYRPP